MSFSSLSLTSFLFVVFLLFPPGQLLSISSLKDVPVDLTVTGKIG